MGEGSPPAGRVGVEGCGVCGDEELSGFRLFSRPGPEGRKPDEVPPPESL